MLTFITERKKFMKKLHVSHCLEPLQSILLILSMHSPFSESKPTRYFVLQDAKPDVIPHNMCNEDGYLAW